jgi:hypothetical protein
MRNAASSLAQMCRAGSVAVGSRVHTWPTPSQSMLLRRISPAPSCSHA